jgi:prepilin-type processing-associated H-X9-DG protein
MKTKTSKQPKQSKRSVQLKDIKPKKDAKGGSRHTGGVNVAMGDGSVRGNLQIADLTSVAIDP